MHNKKKHLGNISFQVRIQNEQRHGGRKRRRASGGRALVGKPVGGGESRAVGLCGPRKGLGGPHAVVQERAVLSAGWMCSVFFTNASLPTAKAAAV